MKTKKQNADKNPAVLITGGSGFLGAALLRELLKKPGRETLSPGEIRIFDTRPPDNASDPRIRYIPGDIRSPEALDEACTGADLVFHCAAIVDWGQAPRSLVHDINVNGTRNVIGAARRAGARALVHTSTMDVIYDGRPITRGDEKKPYPKKFTMAYAETKALAERAVLEADGTRERGTPANAAPLRTCVIRPCGMFGEGDPYHVSSFLKMARGGRLSFRIGSGRSLFQHVYVGNVAHAHVLAARSLLEPEPAAAGRAYIITDFEAKNFFDYMAPILEGIGYRMPPKRRSIPMPVMYALGGIMEFASFLCRPIVRLQPLVSRTSVAMVCKDMTFCGDRACRELGYRPLYSEEEAIARTIEYFRAQEEA
ncbi:MAG TPA: NAD-dependent epimerase/dehydratase family protein [Spirochaetota bacterium]|nr:NAD-dependent epimerase/dehydratase family protein [Spirochaetota bacterium]